MIGDLANFADENHPQTMSLGQPLQNPAIYKAAAQVDTKNGKAFNSALMLKTFTGGPKIPTFGVGGPAASNFGGVFGCPRKLVNG